MQQPVAQLQLLDPLLDVGPPPLPVLQLHRIPRPVIWTGYRGPRTTKRMRVRDNVLDLVFKLATRLSTNWRGINAPNQLYQLLAGYRFVDGQLQLAQPSPEQAAP